MGKKDLSLKSYLSDPMRYADVYNGSVFGGMQILDGTQLEEAGSVRTKSDDDASRERICDLAMRQKNGGELYAIWILENQETVDYGMPVRILLREALEYDRQVQELKRKNEAEPRREQGKASAGEYLYKVKKGERIRPTGTLIIHWGSEPWDGPRSLHEFLDFDGVAGEAAEELKKLVPEYPLHILDLNAENDYSRFHTSLRTVFELYARRTDKQQFRDYVEAHEECRHLDAETYHIIGKLVGSRKLPEQADKEKNGEECDMSNAIDDLFEDGRLEGKAEGKVEGKAEEIIEFGRDFGLSENDILARLQRKLNMTAQAAKEYFDSVVAGGDEVNAAAPAKRAKLEEIAAGIMQLA